MNLVVIGIGILIILASLLWEMWRSDKVGTFLLLVVAIAVFATVFMWRNQHMVDESGEEEIPIKKIEKEE